MFALVLKSPDGEWPITYTYIHKNNIQNQISVPVPFTFVLWHTWMNKESHTSVWNNVRGHNLVVGMGSNFDLHDLLEPHLSPALPYQKWTRVSAGQLDHNIPASMLTFQASLIISTTPHSKWTRVLAGHMWTCDLESLTYLPGTGQLSLHRIRQDKAYWVQHGPEGKCFYSE